MNFFQATLSSSTLKGWFLISQLAGQAEQWVVPYIKRESPSLAPWTHSSRPSAGMHRKPQAMLTIVRGTAAAWPALLVFAPQIASQLQATRPDPSACLATQLLPGDLKEVEMTQNHSLAFSGECF
jgi:hypothetical protein